MGTPEGVSNYCALVAVTTDTDVGVATPSIAAGGGGVTGGGVLPAGGIGAPELPPHPAVSITNAMSIAATNKSRAGRASVSTFDMRANLRKR
jgi:hypothetical protein